MLKILKLLIECKSVESHGISEYEHKGFKKILDIIEETIITKSSEDSSTI